VPNIFNDIPASLPDEAVDVLASGASCRVERIVSHGRVSPDGHASPDGFWYDQDDDEWVMVISGRARLAFEGDAEAIELGPGDYVNIPAHCRHRVDWTDPDSDTVWLAVHYRADGE